MGEMREVLSGRQSMAQLSQEVSSITPEARQRLLDNIFSSPGKFLVQVPPTESLALKSDLQLPWSKLRDMRRYVICRCRRGLA